MSEDNSEGTKAVMNNANNRSNKYQRVLTKESYNLEDHWKRKECRSKRFCLKDSGQWCHIDMRLYHDKIQFLLICEMGENNNSKDVEFKSIIILENDESRCETFIYHSDEYDDSLWAECRIQFKLCSTYKIEFVIEHSKVIESWENVIDARNKLYRHIRSIYEEGKFTDTKIIVKGKEFLAHQMILSQSPVLEAMRHDGNDEVNVILIDNIDPEIFEILLRFLYTGQTGEFNVKLNNNDFILDLIKAAYEYELEELKIELAVIAIRYISVDNVIGMLLVAENCDITKLKIECLSFIMRNGEKVQNTISFRDMVETNLPLTANVLRFALKNYSKSSPN